MRKGQFIFNLLREYMGRGTASENPYPNCHYILFNISDEKWSIIEKEYTKYKRNENYQFPKDPLNGSIMSDEHKEALFKDMKDLLKDFDYYNSKHKKH